MNGTLQSGEGIFGLVGHNIGYSLSPAIHNHIFSTRGMNAVYGLFDLSPDHFDAGIGALLSFASGFNITVPYKERITGHLKELSSEARLTGSVNLVHEGMGHNTDYLALRDILSALPGDLSGQECVVFGSGGAARTASFLLGKMGMSLRILNRTRERSVLLESSLHNEGIDAESMPLGPDIGEEILKSDCFVNTISDPGFHFPAMIGRLAVDFNYGSRAGTFRNRISGDATVISGEEILVRQAIHSQKIWNGIEPPVDEIMGVIDVK